MRRSFDRFSISCIGFAILAAPVSAGTPLTTKRVVSGLTRPLYVTHAPGDFDRIFVVEQPGRIRVYDITSDPPVLLGTFLDIASLVQSGGNEQGLLGLAFHPNYAAPTNGYFYVNYTRLPDGDTVVARYQVSGNPNLANSGSALPLLTINDVQSNHNGGWLAFGRDGYLYVATGDGGGANDEGSNHTAGTGNGQDITTNLLGKMLRIDVDGTDGPGGNYGIPPTNPFVGITGDDEIWAYGLRNPWRNAFDAATGDLYIADVGQNAWEEINFQPGSSTGGENWGWRCREGMHNFNFTANCSDPGITLLDPIHEFSHGGSPFRCSITGGEVYNGCAVSDLVGTYFFADYCSNQIWSFKYAPPTPPTIEERTAELVPTGGGSITSISSFGLDAYGEIYICDLDGGEVFKIIPNAPLAADCNGNMKADACDIRGGTSEDINVNGIPDECEGAPPVPPASEPQAVRKNRYLAFVPSNGGTPAAFKVTRTSPGPAVEVGWVTTPDPNGLAGLAPTSVTRVWSEPVVYVGDCPIIPAARYDVRATANGVVFSAPLSVETIATPVPKFWGDTVGDLQMGAWTGPNLVVNVNDFVAALQWFLGIASAPHVSWVDVQAVSSDDPCLNRDVNIADVFLLIKAFQGETYPFTANPAACPPCP